MSHAQPTMPSFEPTPTMTEAETQEAKHIEKLQAHGSSHHTAGTDEMPAPTVAAPSDRAEGDPR